MIKWKEFRRAEAIILFAAYAQGCAERREIPLTFSNWCRKRNIRLKISDHAVGTAKRYEKTPKEFFHD